MANLQNRPTYDTNVENGNGVSYNEGTRNDQLTSAASTIQSMPLYRLKFPDNECFPKDYVHSIINGYNSQIPEQSKKLTKYYTDEFAEIYVQNISIKLSTALYSEVVERKVNVNSYISFYYANDGTAFVQTSGNVNCEVLKYADVQLPHKIAGRLLDNVGNKSTFKIERFGNRAFQQERYKEFELVAYLRSDASIRSPNLNCLENPEGPIMVKVGITFIQFECNIKKDGMKNFINYLNGICKGSNTYTTTGAKEIDNDVGWMKPVDQQKAELLDSALRKHIESYIRQREDFSKYLNDLHLRRQIDFTFQERIGLINDEMPTLQNVLNKIRANNSENEKLWRVLLCLINGTMMYEHQMYHRFCERWLCMGKDFIRNIHIQFRGFLSDHLITRRPFVLPIPWTNVAKNEPEYNQLYMGHPEFLVGDGCLYTGDVELFDLMRYDAHTQCVYLYFVKKNFNRTIRELAFQVMAAIDILRNVCNKDGQAMLQEFYESIRQKYEEKKRHLPERFNEFEKFENMLSKINQNKLKIICAVFDKAGEHDSIRRERDATDLFGVRDIDEAYLKILKRDQSLIRKHLHRIYSDSSRTESELIFRLLIDKGFVKASGEDNWGYSTSKLLHAHHRNPSWPHYFEIGEQPEFNKIIWKIVKPFSTLFKSTVAKYSFMHMQNCEYEFKICQIRK